MSPRPPADFIRENTILERPPLVPELQLYLASEILPIWRASETELERAGVDPPFWAFAWAGGQALARYLLDHPDVVAGRRVLDFGAGSGLQGLAAAKAGAASVEFNDIDPHALAAIELNAAVNQVSCKLRGDDLIGAAEGWQVVLAGDVCYERPMATRVFAWLRALAGQGVLVLLGDPGRTYKPTEGLARVIGYAVKTTREIEDTDLRNAVVWRVLPL